MYISQNGIILYHELQDNIVLSKMDAAKPVDISSSAYTQWYFRKRGSQRNPFLLLLFFFFLISHQLTPKWAPVCTDCYFSIRSTPVSPQWHVKDPGHSAKSAGAGYT